ncbi:hypothetical protein [Tropicimonas marinistellae]|uniref:hypothetical protein n=1 Tax=Tropicimonas marinistellae TaxID=1739787 RepID=UPI00082E7C70|nr:hypothetical protein [Tropicimonas marinistellae]
MSYRPLDPYCDASPVLFDDAWSALPKARSEVDIIRARVRSRAKWQRRRRWLQLRVQLFGRAKERQPLEPRTIRPACQP